MTNDKNKVFHIEYEYLAATEYYTILIFNKSIEFGNLELSLMLVIELYGLICSWHWINLVF